MADERMVRTITRWIGEEVAERLEANGEVVQSQVKAAVVARLMADRETLRQWLAQSVDTLVYDQVARVAARTRGHVLFAGDIVPAEAARTVRRPTWERWLEHNGRAHVRLWDMGERDLLAAAELRERRGETEYLYAALWRELARGLGPTRRVGDAYTPEQIEAIAARLRVRARVRQVGDRKEEAAD